MIVKKPVRLTAEMAESMAIQALAYLGEAPERLGQFLAATGIGPEQIRAAASEPDFLAGVLEYLAQDESLLVEFATQTGSDPADIVRACQILGRGPLERDIP